MEVDRPLDEIIKSTRNPKKFLSGGKKKGKFPKRRRPMPVQKNFRKLPERWSRDKYANNGGVGVRKFNFGSTKVAVSNLSFMVTDDDIQELFRDFGPLQKASINYDKSGRSHGTADIIFMRAENAHRAIQEYNGVALDGRPMKLQVVSGQESSPSRRLSIGGGKPKMMTQQMKNKRFNRNRIGGGVPQRQNMKSRIGRRNNNKAAPSTKESLDADLDAYKQADVDML